MSKTIEQAGWEYVEALLEVSRHEASMERLQKQLDHHKSVVKDRARTLKSFGTKVPGLLVFDDKLITLTEDNISVTTIIKIVDPDADPS
jgi:hypothetical protein